eukprot:TRINITY_DN46787_c0_g1_i1.p1 TRINITY_DN46787_c0_g1~~TRINITY_DN46787_c0_g1_i1.p1  ORF type:complete len:139 (+),score=23.90 TRINITY_DN46787_c0_g1_i1:104-520(+)
MGCGSSQRCRPRDDEVCKGSTQELDRQTSPGDESEASVTVTLWRRPSKERVGLRVSDQGDGTLRVDGIQEDGMVSDFMRANSHDTDLHLKVGHKIVAVNEVTGDCEAMKQEFEAKIVSLTFRTVDMEATTEASEHATL